MRTVSPVLAFSGLSLASAQRGAVEYEILRPLAHKLVVTFGELAFAAKLLLGVDLALHHVEFVVDLGQAAFGLDQDHAVHAVGDVLCRHRHGAVIDITARVDRREFEAARFAGRRVGRLGAAAGAGDRVEVDIVHHDAVVMVLEMHFDGVADAHADERPRHLLIEGPVAIGRAIGEIARHLDGFKVDLDAPRPPAANRWWQIGRIAHDRNRTIGLNDLADLVRQRRRAICGLRMVHARFARIFCGAGAVAE